MAEYLQKKHLENLIPAYSKDSRTPIPTQIVSNGEFFPPPQSQTQRQVEEKIMEMGDRLGRKLGMSRRKFLQTSAGMAAAFLAMNAVYGPYFATETAEASDPQAANERLAALSNQFIFDAQLHFVHKDYDNKDLLELRKFGWKVNPEIRNEELTLEKFHFQNFVREVFLDSQTTIGLLSSAPSDDPKKWFLHNDQLAEARSMINSVAGSRRMLSHAVITPGRPGWLEEIDKAIEVHKPDSWKGYTIGDPLSQSKYAWRLDDEKLVYPAYEKMVKAGIRNVCIHKGLLPENYEKEFPDTWQHAKVDDVGKAARDWPQLNFIIYHSALKPVGELSGDYLKEFEKTGYIPWVSDLAEIPKQFGVENVYAELGSTFATSAVTHPRHCAVLLGNLVKGMGVEHVIWGTDSVWYGSPQWQIEAFRRIEIPLDLQEKFGFRPLGPADGPVKKAILGGNYARMYEIQLSEDGTYQEATGDRFAQWKAEYDESRPQRTNLAYGLIHRSGR
jgi:uncharacterized protein